MANPEHLARIREGVEVWNQWLKDELTLWPDLGESNLGIADLSYANLSYTNLRGADLSGADLIEAELIGADLREAYLIEAKLNGVSLGGAALSKAYLNRADLSYTSLSYANLSYASLNGANLVGSDLSYTNLSYANLSYASLGGADLSNANLSSVNLSNADLSVTKLSNANLSNADLSNSDLEGANLSNADLSETELQGVNFSNAKLIETDLSKANLEDADLSYTNLSHANLGNAGLHNTNLEGAELYNANLSQADLSKTDFSKANLSKAVLSGTIIEDWHIVRSTKLDGVRCDYIFRKRDPETGEPSARLPVDPNSVFVPGEFAQRFQILESALETIDLTFTKGIDWKAFFTSFQELRQQHPDEEISIQGIERKGEALIVRLEVPEASDKGAIETCAKQLYETQLKALEAQYEQQLRLQGAHLEDIRAILEFERQERTRLSKVVEKMADEQKAPKYDLRGAQFSGGFAETVEGDQIGGTQHNYATSEKQSLADAALEIQCLLKQLEATNPTATEAEQKAFVTAAIPATLRQRAVGALQSGGRAAVEELLDNPYVNIALAVIEGWRTVE